MPGVEVLDIFKAMKEAGMVMVSEKALIPPHGSGALLSSAGVRPGMPSAIRRNSGGLKLPLFPSVNVNEIIEIFTAQDAASGSNATTWCAAGPIAGNLRTLQVISLFGKFKMQTNVIVAPEVAERLNYADVDREVIGGFGFREDNYFIPDVVRRAGNINTTLGKELIQFGINAESAFQRVDITGNVTTLPASTYLGFIREPEGLARLIKTGYADPTGPTAAPAADSVVRTYGATLSSSIVTALSDLIRTLKQIAMMVKKPNVVWEIQLNFRMWSALVDLWACNYAIARCSTSDNAAGTVDLGRISQLRDEMFRGNYLLVDGEPIPVNLNAGVPVEDGATTNEFSSDIFVVPMYDPDSVMGKVKDGVEWLTYREYFPFDNDQIKQLIAEGWSDLEWMNNGLYLVGSTYGTDSFCKSKVFGAKTRLMLPYPFLAGRLDDVTFTNSNPEAGTPYQAESDYRGGGVASR